MKCLIDFFGMTIKMKILILIDHILMHHLKKDNKNKNLKLKMMLIIKNKKK